MPRKIITTADGSHSIALEESNDTYHSRYGAIQESTHVFIGTGLLPLLRSQETICVFEMGFGTGLNALLTCIEAEKTRQKIYYEAIELYPLGDDIAGALNYCERLQRTGLKESFEEMHVGEWEKEINISPYFSFKKRKSDMIDYNSSISFHLIYYDAFAPNAQPELWTKEVLLKLYKLLAANGILVTYCSKGEVRRNMQALGFMVKKVPGPKGKREIIKAIKQSGE
ncbi:MAG: tRNA (5-methylaminomethyl-2-thiouridine)(34)-methyltransferase MnmD [Bacteroidetes bacterium]|nr:tRNA (5-methylaminomethyl-2-thiouridine)(34)-methyltransferase MnmD [Bacteroidota bacterium]MBS1972783.1 tRNA (5-methylaminomethyl-2-thiouridine)(34)-methyltransferase MnmD [Bacteroidota bacterium]